MLRRRAQHEISEFHYVIVILHGRALPGRRNLVLSRAPLAGGADPLPPGTTLEAVTSIGAALQRCAGSEELCVIGGAEVFRAMLPQATDLHLTRVRAAPDGDVLLPAIDEQAWRETGRLDHPADQHHAWPMTFIDLVRR